MSDEEEWKLTDKRLGEVLAMVKETPCARSAYCKDAEASVRFALHVIADKALTELIELRFARAADAERVRSAVERAAAGVLGPNGPVMGSWDVAARAIADRVAEQLAVPGVAWSPDELETIRGMRESRYLSADEAAVLDRMLASPATPAALTAVERGALRALLKETVVDEYPMSRAVIERLLAGGAP